MPVRVTPAAKPSQDVPSMAEFDALTARVAANEEDIATLNMEVENLDTRVSALEDDDGGEPEPPDPPDPPATGTLVCTINIGGQSYEYRESDATDLGDYCDPRGRFVMSNKRLFTPDCPIAVDFRHAGDWACMIFCFGDPSSTSAEDLPAYTVDIPADITARFRLDLRPGRRNHKRLTEISLRLSETVQVPNHWKFARWRWQNMDWPFPLVPIEELMADKLLPELNAAMTHGTGRTYGPLYYTPMSLCGIFPQMGAGGQRPDIGPTTDWQAEYICTQSQTSLDNVLAQGEAGGTIPWWLRQPETGSLIDSTSEQWKGASFYYGTGSPQLVHGAGSGIQIDSAHEPSVAYLPFVLTGDPYFLETLQAQVMYFIVSQPGGWYNQGNGLWCPMGMGQTRGVAWINRDLMQAAAVTPDDAPDWLIPRSKFVELMNWSVAGLVDITKQTEPLRSVFRAVAGSRGDYANTGPGGTIPAGCWYITWQEDFVACVTNWAEMLHPDVEGFHTFNVWHNQGLKDRVNWDLHNGWNQGWPELYWTAFQDVREGPQYASWDVAWDRNSTVQGLAPRPLSAVFTDPAGYDYPNNLEAGLAMAVQAGHTDCQPALTFLSDALHAGIIAGIGGKEFKWAVVHS